jgi:hypothetical protein
VWWDAWTTADSYSVEALGSAHYANQGRPMWGVGSESKSHADRNRLKREALPTGVLPSQKRFAVGGRYWVRTSDLFGVNEARYHCANRPKRRMSDAHHIPCSSRDSKMSAAINGLFSDCLLVNSGIQQENASYHDAATSNLQIDCRFHVSEPEGEAVSREQGDSRVPRRWRDLCGDRQHLSDQREDRFLTCLQPAAEDPHL